MSDVVGMELSVEIDSRPEKGIIRDRPLFRALLATGVSVVLHAGLIGVGAVVAWSVRPVGTGIGSSTEYVFESATVLDETAPAAEDAPSSDAVGASRPEPAADSEVPSARPPSASGRLAELVEGPAPVLHGLSSRPPAAESIALRSSIATAPDAGAALRRTGQGVTFAGLAAARARSVVYAVDASGPMVTSLPMVMREVERSVARLGPTQRFSVVLFRDAGDAETRDLSGFAPGSVMTGRYAAFSTALVRAGAETKGLLHAWLGAFDPRGRSNPLDGLSSALAMRPDVIFLFSRSIERSGGGVWELGLDRTLEELEALNPVDRATGRRATIIKTIQFLEEDPTGIMQAIGRLHGDGEGAYTVVLPRSKLTGD
ncbi:MAG: hypothetical protein JNM07_11970 [Phycisphaerae bacterium]|nr:hypothetical protein [Phycisphaerae bacterium]